MKRFAGLFILLAVIAIGAIFYVRQRGTGAVTGGLTGAPTVGDRANNGGGAGGNPTGEVIELKGLTGGEKLPIFQDVEIQKILLERYRLKVQADKRGSIEMVKGEQPADRDFLWTSQVGLDLFKSANGKMVKAETLLNSPIVLYTWEPVTEALIRKRIVEKRADSYFVVNFPKLVKAIQDGATWKDMGLPQLYGPVTIFTTDPNASSSGGIFTGLLANTLNSGQVVGEDSLQKVLPELKKFFDRQGFMESSSETIFRQFLAKGIGDKPVIVGYEAQMIGFLTDSDTRMQSRRKQIRTLYPQPTVWTSHPLIALTDNGAKLIDALQDPEIQRLAWQKHGFRSAVGADNDVKALGLPGIPPTIENVIPMPRSRVMEKILEALK